MSIFNLPCQHNDWKECRYCHGVKAQDGWRFKGCFCPPLKGKFLAEVKECPLKAQKVE
jgi:hypothetical protein